MELVKADIVETEAPRGYAGADPMSVREFCLEMTAPRHIWAMATREMGLCRSNMVHSPRNPMSGILLERLFDAEEQGVISTYADMEVFQTDVILQAQRRSNRETVWVVVEISNTISRQDVAWARERADILAAAYSQTALAAVAGREIRQEEQEMADSLGVTVFML